jgi:hypothetical protein
MWCIRSGVPEAEPAVLALETQATAGGMHLKLTRRTAIHGVVGIGRPVAGTQLCDAAVHPAAVNLQRELLDGYPGLLRALPANLHRR